MVVVVETKYCLPHTLPPPIDIDDDGNEDVTSCLSLSVSLDYEMFPMRKEICARLDDKCFRLSDLQDYYRHTYLGDSTRLANVSRHLRSLSLVAHFHFTPPSARGDQTLSLTSSYHFFHLDRLIHLNLSNPFLSCPLRFNSEKIYFYFYHCQGNCDETSLGEKRKRKREGEDESEKSSDLCAR